MNDQEKMRSRLNDLANDLINSADETSREQLIEKVFAVFNDIFVGAFLNDFM